jgi:hypothetical protein
VPFVLPGKKMKTTTPIASGRTPPVLLMAAAFWLAGIVAVLAWIGIYSNTPSAPGQPPERWPKHSQLPRVAGQPALVMFVHPRCPCSRASLGELARLLVSARGQGSVQVVFLNPTGMTPDWAETDLWRQAAELPGVAVYLDQDGTEAKRFGAETSGQTLLYSAGSELLFQGGHHPFARTFRGQSGAHGAGAVAGRIEVQTWRRLPLLGVRFLPRAVRKEP